MSVKKVNKSTGATTKVAGLVNSEKVNTMYRAFPSDASASNKLVSDSTADEKISDESQVIFEVMGKNGAKNILPFVYNQNVTNTQNCTASESNEVVTYTPSGIYSRMAYAYNGALEIGVSYRVRFKAKFTKAGDPLSYALRSNYDWEDSGNYVFQIISSSTSDYVTIDEVFTATSEDLYLLFYVARGNSYSGNKLEIKELQINLASDSDPTFQPYAKTNQELTAANETLTNQVKDMNNVYGAKNVLDLTVRLKKGFPKASAIVSFSNEGIVFNGTVSSSGSIRINPAEDDNSFVLPQGTYVLSHKDGQSPSGTSITLRKNGTALTTNNRLATPYEFEANGTDYFTVLIHEDATTFDNAIVCPMICLKSSYELDTSFEPYAKTNQQLTEDNIALIDDTTALLDNLEVNGAVNMLPNNATTQTINGVTFTVNDDGTIDVSGTATANANLTIGSFNVKAGTSYTISDGIGTLEHDDKAGSMFATSAPAQGEATWYWRTDYIGAPTDRRTATANYDAVVTVTIRIPSGVTVDYKFKPMFTLASYNGNYVPYAMSNRELTEIVDPLKTQFDADHNIVKTVYPTLNVYLTDNAMPSDWSNLTTQQATDIAQALYDVFKKIGGVGGIRYSGILYHYYRKASDGSELGSSRDIVDIYSNASYSSMLSNNANARFTMVRHPYGSTAQTTYALWGNKLMYSSHGINAVGIVSDYDKIYTYNTISTYKG